MGKKNFYGCVKVGAPPKKRPRKKPVFSGAPNLAKLKNKKKTSKKNDFRSHIVFLEVVACPKNSLTCISEHFLVGKNIFYGRAEFGAPPKKRPRKNPVFSGAPNLAKLKNKRKKREKNDSRSDIVFF